MAQKQSGVPYRQFCKESLWLYKEAQQYLSGGVCREAIVNIVLLVVLHRGWFNRNDHFKDFLEHYGQPLDAKNFDFEAAKRAALKMLS